MVEDLNTALWQFSIRIYRDRVPGACLLLQDRHRFDVNILLFCLFQARTSAQGDDTNALKRVMAAADPWHRQIVQHIRQARRDLKLALNAHAGALPDQAGKALYQKVLAAEIDCEQAEQAIIAKVAWPDEPVICVQSPSDYRNRALRLIETYAESLNCTLAPSDHDAVSVLLEAACAELG